MISLLNNKKRNWRSGNNRAIINLILINLLVGIIALITKSRDSKHCYILLVYTFFIIIMYMPVAEFFKDFYGKSKYIHILPLSKIQIFLLSVRDWFYLLIIFMVLNLSISFLLIEKPIKYIISNLDIANIIPICIYKLTSVLLMAGIIISLGIMFKVYKKYWTIGTVVFIGISNLILNSLFYKSLIVFKFWTNLNLEDLVFLGGIVTIPTSYVQEIVSLSYILTAIIEGMIILFAFSKLNKISIE